MNKVSAAKAVAGTPLVLPLADAAATLERVGGKGMSLAKMLGAGLPVPGGFHVTTEAYRRFIAANGLQPRIMGALAGLDPADTAALDAASAAIRSAFAAGTTPPAIAAAVASAYAALGDAPVAVRSSATAEDLPGASFAGQQETYLNVRGGDAVLAAVERCWASLWTARAIAYRLNNDIDQETVALAVVVQELIFADAAGIMFTADPVTGKRNELLINAAWGLGEAVVSGAVTPDTLTVAKGSGKVVKRETAEKAIMTVRTADGTREMPVPGPQQAQPVLSDAQAAQLANLGVIIEQFYGTPMDVEWALAEGKFAIVQARPITALPPDWTNPEPKAIWMRGSLAEHTPSPVSPLFATLGLGVANEATARLWQVVLGKDWDAFLPHGGAYQSLNNYVYLGFRMGSWNLWPLTKITLTQMGPMFRGAVARWQAGREELAAVVEQWEREPVEAIPPSRLLEGVRAVFGAACVYYTVIQSTLPAAAGADVTFAKFYDSLIRRKQDPPATVFVLGLETDALRAEKSLYDIAGWVRAEPDLAAYVAATPTDALALDLRRESPPAELPPALWDEWRARFQRHLEEHGRTAYEFDFAMPTPQDAPGPLFDIVKAFLAGAAASPYERQRAAAEKREQATQAVLARLDPARKSLFLKLLHWAQGTGPMREDAIFAMGMGHPLIRRMLGELGRRFAEGGAIQEADDIYWLEREEVDQLIAALEGGNALPDYSGRIPARKEQWHAALKVDAPVMLPKDSFWRHFIHGAEAETKDGKVVLKGAGTSGGVVTAPARVLFGPEDFGLLQQGDVLVAVTTTPAWTPLFARAAAVVTDIGGPLSHSSIVAREYGIPAVMAARSATRAIHSGQTVTVDGNKGTVTLEGQ